MAMTLWSNPTPSEDTMARLSSQFKVDAPSIGPIVAAILADRRAKEQQQQDQLDSIMKGISGVAGQYKQSQDQSALAAQLGGPNVSSDLQLKLYELEMQKQLPQVATVGGAQFYNSGQGYRPLSQGASGEMTAAQMQNQDWREEQRVRDDNWRDEQRRRDLEKYRGDLQGQAEVESRKIADEGAKVWEEHKDSSGKYTGDEAAYNKRYRDVPFSGRDRLKAIEDELARPRTPRTQGGGGDINAQVAQIRAAAQSGQITREDALAQLRALGFQ